MAKDYFQDITPASGAPTPPPMRTIRENPPAPAPQTAPTPVPISVVAETESAEPNISQVPQKTIRNIQMPAKPRARVGGPDVREIPELPPEKKSGRSSLWIWGSAVFFIFVLGVLAFVALRPTTVSVVPRSHTVIFDQTASVIAHPADSAASSTLPYTMETSELEDSEVVPTQGTEYVEEKASGTITVFNDYSAQPVNLIKNTRFETPEGLIFRVPADIVIPGRKTGAPGQISVTVFADAAGAEYNIGPVVRLSVPGLKSNAPMYTGVYARSTTAMAGGFKGERPGVAPGALDAAKTAVRGRLESNARESARTRADAGSVAFSELLRITYESLPQTVEAGGGIRIHERARVELPVFPADRFADIVAANVSADAGGGTISLQEGADFTARAGEMASDGSFSFTLGGTATLVWNIDIEGIQAALAGRDESAFQTIINGFPGIEEARARIEPFWKKTFPADPSAIKVRVEEPAEGAGA